jgi:RHS repeat-associated protein
MNQTLLLTRFLLALVVITAPARAELDSTRLSLPKGPGSIEGLASADFTPNPANGQARYSIPIVVPPAARSFGPSLSLSYDSGAGVSELGVGWRLGGVPSVRRRTEDGLPRFDDTDSFEVVGIGIPSELLEVEPGIYRPRYEDGSFVRAERQGEQWEIRTKAGQVLSFGGADAAVAEAGKVAVYLLRRARDLRGHEVRYEWTTEGAYPLLQRVVWNEFGREFVNEVTFEYEERPDPSRLFSSGIGQTLQERLIAVSVRHGGSLVRRYELGYDDAVHPRLTSVVQVGADGQSRLPESRFGYSSGALTDENTPVLVDMLAAPGRSPAQADTSLVDLNGDGLPDLLIGAAGAYRSVLNRDGVTWEPGQDWPLANSPSFSLSKSGVQMADFDGDGGADLLISGDGVEPRYLARPSELGFETEVQVDGFLDLSLEDPNVRLADFDGDRRTDFAMTTEAGLLIATNRDGVAFNAAQQVTVIDPEQTVLFENVGTNLCDLNGDRVQDICVLESGSLVYYLGRGYGSFEPAEEATGVPEFEPNEAFSVRDLDGDGWDDLVRVGTTAVTYALAEAEGIFGPVRELSDVPTNSGNTHTLFQDMNGSGTVDIVWIEVAGSDTASWRYLELFPEGRGGLLTKIENGLGKTQTIEYASAASFAAAARQQGAPWTSRLNLPLSVVSKVTVSSGLEDPVLAVEYSYADGVYAPAERTFAAFSLVVVRTLGDEFTPALVSEQHYEPGLSRRALRGTLLFEEKRAEAGAVFSRQTCEYREQTLEVALDGRTVESGYRSAILTELVEGEEDSSVVTLTEVEQDAFGNVVVERNWGVIEGDDYLAGGDEAITTRTFANDEEDWVLGYLATETLQNGVSEQVSAVRKHYDGEAFHGLPLGQVTRGELTREEAWVGPAADEFELVTATRYDDHGLPVETTDARGGGRFFTWDAAHTAVLAEGVKLHRDTAPDGARLVERAKYDGRFGALVEVTDYGGSITRYGYDTFGRLQAVIRPGDSEGLPTLRYSYEIGAPVSRVITEARVTSGKQAVERREDVFDGLGRKRASFVHDAELWLMAGVSFYDARGEARRTLLPRWVSESDRRSLPLHEKGEGHDTWRDALGRELHTLSAEGVTTRTSYSPLRSRHWDGGQADESSPFEHTPTVSVQDGLGRTIAHQRSLGGSEVSASYVYDAGGRLLRRTDPEGNVQSFRYDGRGRRTQVDDPDQGQHRFGYDGAGNLVWHEYPDGKRTTATYDLAGRPLSEDWDADGTPEIVQEYDEGSDLHLGKLVRIMEPSGAVEHTYDERGRVTETLYRIGGADYRVGSRYDAQDRESEHVYPDGSRLEIRRNARGQLSAYGELLRVEYGSQGGETLRRFSTGVEIRNEHDHDNRRRGFEFRSADRQKVEHLRWNYDRGGNLTSVVDERPEVSEEHDRTEIYDYDNLYHLTGVSGAWGSSEWTYSPSGNLLARRSSIEAQDAPELGYGSRPHAPTSLGERALEYDPRGRMTSDGVRSYDWDGASHLARVSSKEGSVESVYGQGGARRLRVETNKNGVKSTTHFIDGWSEVKNGELVRYVVHGGERIVRLSAGPREEAASEARTTTGPWTWTRGVLGLCVFAFALASWIARSVRAIALRRGLALALVAAVAAHLTGCSAAEDRALAGQTIGKLVPGDVLLVTDQVGSLLGEFDERGERLTEVALLPYGFARHDDSAETNKYAGAPRDGLTGLDHMGARFYAPDLGVWTSPDPIALTAPEQQVNAELGAAHPYAYANHRPVLAADRDGKFWHIAIGALVGAATGATIEAVTQYVEHGRIVDAGRIAGAAAGGGLTGGLLAANPLGGLAWKVTAEVAGGMVGRYVASDGQNVGTWQDAMMDASGPLAGEGLKVAGALGRKAAKEVPIGRAPGPTLDPATGRPVGRFVVDPKGNAMIEPVGGSTIPAGPGGVDTHTLYPNGSNYQRLNPQGHATDPTPHGHGHLEGSGPNMKGQGPSIDPQGNVVPWKSAEAHWPIQ